MTRIALILAGLFWVTSNPGFTLEFSLHTNNTKSLTGILATGIVEKGDVERLRKFLRQLTLKKNVAVYLASPGGDLYEGMGLGLFLHENRIRTVVEGGFDCASACALAFLGGTGNDGKPWRSSSTDSRLGFHAFKGIADSTIHPDEVQSCATAKPSTHQLT